MALTRGNNGLQPCPVCDIAAGLQSKVRAIRTRRNANDIKAIVLNTALNRTRKDELLKPMGMRAEQVSKSTSISQIQEFLHFPLHQNAFWLVANSDPHEALSVDRLHANAGGMTSDHIWPTFQDHVDKMLGRQAMGQIDQQYEKSQILLDI